jgi:hypothetical protein
MSRPAADDWVLNEAEALLDTDGRRERLEQVAARLQNGEVLPVGHMTARSRIRQRLDALGGAQTLDLRRPMPWTCSPSRPLLHRRPGTSGRWRPDLAEDDAGLGRGQAGPLWPGRRQLTCRAGRQAGSGARRSGCR